MSPDTLLLPLKKTLRNSLSDRILVGRSGNNDIIISDKTVSKTHGWFLPPEDEYQLWRFYDKDATNGTTINLKRVPPKSATFIRSGDEIHFGNMRILFLHPDDAYGLCEYVKVEWKRASELGLPRTVQADTIRLHGSSTSGGPLQKTSV
jgi:hypothetical protein